MAIVRLVEYLCPRLQENVTLRMLLSESDSVNHGEGASSTPEAIGCTGLDRCGVRKADGRLDWFLCEHNDAPGLDV
jgi:hypothetical protein